MGAHAHGYICVRVVCTHVWACVPWWPWLWAWVCVWGPACYVCGCMCVWCPSYKKKGIKYVYWSSIILTCYLILIHFPLNRLFDSMMFIFFFTFLGVICLLNNERNGLYICTIIYIYIYANVTRVNLLLYLSNSHSHWSMDISNCSKYTWDFLIFHKFLRIHEELRYEAI